MKDVKEVSEKEEEGVSQHHQIFISLSLHPLYRAVSGYILSLWAGKQFLPVSVCGT